MMFTFWIILAGMFSSQIKRVGDHLVRLFFHNISLLPFPCSFIWMESVHMYMHFVINVLVQWSTINAAPARSHWPLLMMSQMSTFFESTQFGACRVRRQGRIPLTKSQKILLWKLSDKIIPKEYSIASKAKKVENEDARFIPVLLKVTNWTRQKPWEKERKNMNSLLSFFHSFWLKVQSGRQRYIPELPSGELQHFFLLRYKVNWIKIWGFKATRNTHTHT